MYGGRTIWVAPTADLDRMLQTACPDCGQETPVVRGTAAKFLLADHLGRDGETCSAANAEIHRRLTRLKTWEETRRWSDSAEPTSIANARSGI